MNPGFAPGQGNAANETGSLANTSYECTRVGSSQASKDGGDIPALSLAVGLDTA
jgi:hypothetical protein